MVTLLLVGCSSGHAPSSVDASVAADASLESSEIVPCTLDDFPEDGERCDPAELPDGYVCQTHGDRACGGCTDFVCRCDGGRWSCVPGGCFDYGPERAYGCGTPPVCQAWSLCSR